jgi:zinc protease
MTTLLDRTTPPAYQTQQQVTMPTFDTVVLDNGIKAYIVSLGEQPVFRLEMVFEAGTWAETQAGVSYFCTKMLGEGTLHHSSVQIHEYFDQFGSFVEYTQGVDRATVTTHGMTKHLPQLLQMLVDILQEATIPQKELDNLKRITLQNYKVNQEKNAHIAGQIFRANLYGENHPYGFAMTEAVIRDVAQEDIKNFYVQQFQQKPFSLFLAGKITDSDIQIINQTLGQIAVGAAPSFIDKPFTASQLQAHIVEKENAVQSSIRIGQRTITRHHPDYTKLLLTNEVLGGYFGSRLMKNIREEKGYTYGISSATPQLARDGYFIIGTDVKKENTQATLDEITKEISLLQTEEVPLDELNTARSYMIGQFVGSLNTPFEIADRQKIAILDNLPSSYYNNHIARLNAITPADIMETAKKYLPLDNFTEVIVGGK